MTPESKEPFDLEKEARLIVFGTNGPSSFVKKYNNPGEEIEEIAAFGRRCQDEALEKAAQEFEKFGKGDRIETRHVGVCLRSFKSPPPQKEKP